jgi:hypothetical protein
MHAVGGKHRPIARQRKTRKNLLLRTSHQRLRPLYENFCRTAYAPLHHQPWWLDAVCGSPDAWQAAVATDAGGQAIGILPYHPARRWGLRTLSLPPLSNYAGPWLHYPQNPDFKEVSRLAFEKKTMGDLIGQLPRAAFFQQNFRPEITNWLPFYWENFRQTTRYTYLLPPAENWETATANFKNTLRTDLKKAEQAAEMRRDDKAWETVFRLNQLSFERKRQTSPYSLAAFQRLHAALQLRHQSAAFVAHERASGQPCAGLYLAFDARQASVLLTGVHPSFKANCAIFGLFAEAIRLCAERGLVLDFEGSMDRGIEHFFRSFGARLTPYFQIWKAGNKLLELAKWL